MEQVSREDGQMRQASAAFSEAFQKTLSQGATSGSRFGTGSYFSSGRNSSHSRADSAALDIGRTVADNHRSELGENYGRVVSAVAEAALGAKGAGIVQGSLASNLASNHGVAQSTAQAIEKSMRTAVTKGSSTDAKLTEAIAADYRKEESNYYSNEQGLKYDKSLRASADEVVARSQSYRQVVSESRGARVDQQLRATDVAQRFAQDPELRGSLREHVKQLGLGGAVERYLDSKQGAWLTSQFNGDEQKAYDVASLLMLNGRAGAPSMNPERAQIAKDAANSLIYRGFGANFGGFGSTADYQGVGALAPSIGAVPGKVAPEVASAASNAAPDQRPQGVAGPGGYGPLVDDAFTGHSDKLAPSIGAVPGKVASEAAPATSNAAPDQLPQGVTGSGVYGPLVDDAFTRHSAKVASAGEVNELQLAHKELDFASGSLLDTQREINVNATSAETASRVFHSVNETASRVGDIFGKNNEIEPKGKLDGNTAGVADNLQNRADIYSQHAQGAGLYTAQSQYYALERYTSDAGTQASGAALSLVGAKTNAMEQREALRQQVINEAGGGNVGTAVADVISHSARTGTDAGLRQVGNYNETRARFERLNQGTSNPVGAAPNLTGQTIGAGTPEPLSITISRPSGNSPFRRP
jgi:hypothetical protein